MFSNDVFDVFSLPNVIKVKGDPIRANIFEKILQVYFHTKVV